MPGSIGALSSLSYLALYDNLLPTDYNVTLNTLGLNFTVDYLDQRQLILKPGLSPYTINSENDLKNIDLFSMVSMDDGSNVFLGQQLILENYVDENNNVIDINDYIQSGRIVKSGKVYAQVREVGAGLFPNNSDHALTTETIELNFDLVLYDLTFDLNGGAGTIPPTQQLAEGDTGVPVTTPLRDGFTFTGWNTAKDGNSIDWVPDATPMLAENITLYAQWKENAKPVPPVTAGSENNETGHIAGGALPKTGGFEIQLIGMLISGLGAAIGFKSLRKNR